MSVAENLAVIHREISRSALKAGRDPGMIKIIAVTKNVSAEKAREAVAAGILDLGENRVQELQNKFAHVRGVHWHLIGHLQSNKVKYIMDKADLVHSLDRWSLARELDHRAGEWHKVMPVLLQVNVAGEQTKFGLPVDEVRDFAMAVAELKGIKIQGLMTIAPLVDHAEEVRPVFRELKNISDGLKDIPGVCMDQLSMGMTNDYAVAIEEGATMVRVGTAIFGYRE